MKPLAYFGMVSIFAILFILARAAFIPFHDCMGFGRTVYFGYHSFFIECNEEIWAERRR